MVENTPPYSPLLTVSILEGDEPLAERSEGLEALLADLLPEDQVQPVLAEVLRRWEARQSGPPGTANNSSSSEADHAGLDISDQLHQIMEQKMSVFSAKKVVKSEEQLQIKAAILASYSQVCFMIPIVNQLPSGSSVWQWSLVLFFLKEILIY